VFQTDDADRDGQLEVGTTGLVLARVAYTHSVSSSELIDVALAGESGASALSATPDHPFWIAEVGDFVVLEGVEPGMVLRTSNEGDARVLSVERRLAGDVVFNFEVEAAHNYFVQPADGVTGVLVHNCSKTSAPNAGALEARAGQVHGALDPIAQNSRTTAVLRTDGGDIVAAGGRDLNPAQRAMLGEGETAAKLPGAHAEVTALDGAAKAGGKPEAIGVSRPICTDCQQAIEASGGTLTSPTTAIWEP
jgi:hypothetical protein